MGKNNDNFKDNLGCFLVGLAFLSGLYLFGIIISLNTVIEDVKYGKYVNIYVGVISVLIIFLSISYNKARTLKENCLREIKMVRKNYFEKENKLKEECGRIKVDLQHQYLAQEKKLKYKYDNLNFLLEKREEKMKQILQSSSPFKVVSTLYADAILCIYDEVAKYLRNKSHPALSASAEVKRMKSNTRIAVEDYKQMLYKYEFLLGIFPELRNYVDDEEALLSLEKNKSYDDFNDNRDIARDYLSKEEWEKLGVDERNQLALDRYKVRPKSNWKIGIEYEMYIDYILRLRGFKTVPYGSLNGLNDLGRDILAFKTDKDGNNLVYIIQCKNWSSNKMIHENIVCQIFGSAVEYKIKHKDDMFLKVIPVICSTAPLSEMAKEFAKRLGVLIRIVKKGDYPMIKCNVSNDGKKIYHLPFDQQYYTAEICKPGEFYAWTVKEAVEAGFRRAFKYNYDKK